MLCAYCSDHALLGPKVLMQGKLFQRCTYFLYCSVLSLGGNVNTRRMSQPDMESIFTKIVLSGKIRHLKNNIERTRISRWLGRENEENVARTRNSAIPRFVVKKNL